jgi:hypothetical protein
MTAAEITFLIVLIGTVAGIYFTYRIIRECDRDEDDDEIWS